MNLGKKYKQIFEGRKKDYFTKLKENDFRPGDRFGGQDGMDRADAVADQQEPLDIQYYSDEINTLLTSIEDFHQELGTAIEMKGDETGDYTYETAEKQISRYLMGTVKQLEGLQKYLERQKGNL